MAMIYFGLFLWIAVHLCPSLAPSAKQKIVARIGDNTYQGIFALLVFAGLMMIIFGWRNSIPEHVYYPMAGLRHPAMLLAVIGIILFVASNFPTRIKRVIRHPQLTGVLLWAIAHLLVNGDSRSLTVFGALAAWSLVSMFTINRRDGAWVKPRPTKGWWLEGVIVVLGLVVSVLLVRFHQYLAGVALVSQE
jgi:uncharacterized membrane protein